MLVFACFLLAFVVLCQYLNHASSKNEWKRLAAEYNEMLDSRGDRIRIEREANDWLRKQMVDKDAEIRRLSQKYRSPDVAVTMEIRQLFAHYGGPERTAAIIAENYGRLDEKVHQLEEELHLVRGLYEDAVGI